MYFNFCIRFRLNENDGHYVFTVSTPGKNVWFHTVMVYNGPKKGITIHIDGKSVGTQTDRGTRKYDENVRQVVIGRRSSDEDDDYVSALVDEVMFWDKRLTNEESMYTYKY